jgi:hypothetical protein
MPPSGYENTIHHTLHMFNWRYIYARKIQDKRTGRWTSGIGPADAKGWPDNLAIHEPTGIVLAAEVKTETDRKLYPRAEQVGWLRTWHTVPSAAAVVFRSSDDFDTTVAMLRNPSTLRSGWGWLPDDEHRNPVTRQQLEILWKRELFRPAGEV